MKLAAAAIVLVVFAVPASAAAQDEAPACPTGYTSVMSVGGPLCVNPVYLSAPWEDPATCSNGYFLGACVPDVYAELPPVVFESAAYTYQTIPVVVPDPVVQVERVADDMLCLIQRPC